jgi:hypothetical protein
MTDCNSVTVERIDRALHTVAKMIVKHRLPLGPTIDYLEAERDKLLRETSVLDRAKQILAREGRNRGSNTTDLKAA